jgi:hypothetical protein
MATLVTKDTKALNNQVLCWKAWCVELNIEGNVLANDLWCKLQ